MSLKDFREFARVRPIDMWVVVVRSKRTRWMHHGTIRRTRGEAIREYLKEWENGPWTQWKYHARRGVECIKVSVIPALG